MKIQQKKYSEQQGWITIQDSNIPAANYNFVMAFGCRKILSKDTIYSEIRKNFPNATILINSTAGEIIGTEVYDGTISLTAISFEKTAIKTVAVNIKDFKDSFEAGRALVYKLDVMELKNILLISDGHDVNGSDLVKGMEDVLPEKIIITGGLAGDGTAFEKTLVGLNETPVEGRIAAVGFYGNSLSVTYGSVGGWDPFGPERLITKSKKNILYELDGKPALEIYKRYLGEYAAELPASGLLFPLSIRKKFSSTPLVRTILSINEDEQSITFAGNMPEGAYARFMNANFDSLIEGASSAAQRSVHDKIKHPDLALLISCVGRKIVLDQRIEEEIEVVKAIYGTNTAITGFYSYGEISPSFNFNKCELHNQTMTITTFTEE